MAEDTATPGTGGGMGELYGDLWVVARDLDPSDGGGNGEPVLDENGQIVPIGYNPDTDETFPIHLVEGAEGDYEVPAHLEPFVQEVELERANIIRAPDNVMENALEEALGKIEAGTEISTDASGRIMVDGVLIDSPRENVALYEMIMTAGGATSWTEVQANAADNLPAPIADLIASGWDPTGLLAGVFSKFNPISLDAVITAHTLMGVNEVTGSGDTLNIDHFGFTDGATETFDYDRVATYGDVWVRWYQDMDGNPSDLEAVQRTLLDVIWGTDDNGDGVNDVGSGVGWTDQYMKLSDDGLSFQMADGSAAGINDWAQAVEDSRQAIYVLHEFIGAEEIAPPPDHDDVLEGTPCADLLAGWGGNDRIYGLAGDDILEGGEGNDTVFGDEGDDYIEGGAGDDTLYAGDGNDQVYGGDGSDVIGGGTGDDSLFGEAGNDTIYGNIGVDDISGGDGDDLVFGGDGADIVSGGTGADEIYGGAGDDMVLGEAGNDTIEGGTGNDTLYAGDGDDTILGGDGSDLIGGSVGNDVLSGDAGNDTIYGNIGMDDVSGGDGDDLLFGGNGDDTVDGGAGSDSIFGGTGNDTLTGGLDNDKFVFVTGFGDDNVTDFAIGEDTLSLDEALWGGGLSATEVVDTYASVVGADVVLDFGDSSLTLLGLGTTTGLDGDIIVFA